MCGIGAWLLHEPSSDAPRYSRLFLDALAARGPDDAGVCLLGPDLDVRHLRTPRSDPALEALPEVGSPESRRPHTAGLVNTRFAIFDPSAAGHQPFASADRLAVATFNGEIYNHRELRTELEGAGARFRSGTDTEVLVEGYRAWGDDLWNRLNGFWAVVLIDRERRRAVVSRDRFGIVPLYVRETAAGLFMSSLLRPLIALDPSGLTPDLVSLQGFIDTELKDFRDETLLAARGGGPGILRVPPATVTELELPAAGRAPALRWHAAPRRRYWSFPDRRFAPGELSIEEAAERFRSLLVDSVALRLRADVPVALELSGGLDSSSVVAAAVLAGARPVTYTLAHPERNEEPFARRLRDLHPIDYRVVSPTSGFAAEAAHFLAIHEEPYHAPNAYTHYAMRRTMREEGFRVALAGSGGDELLAGYESDFWSAAKREMANDGRGGAAVTYELAAALRSGARARLTGRRAVDRLRRALGRPATPGVEGVAARTGAPSADGLRGGGGTSGSSAIGPSAAHRHRADYAGLAFPEQRRFHFDIGMLPHYLASDDRYSMSLPVEHRLPFLDHRLVELAFRLRAEHLFRRGWTKYVLRRAMAPHLPRAVVWRREKMGFPLDLPALLRRNREWLEPDHRHAVRVLGTAGRDWETLLAREPQRLWRSAVSGAWLGLIASDWGVPIPGDG